MEKKPAITIFGTGAVGTALQDFFENEGYLIYSVWNSSGGLVYHKPSKLLKPVSFTFPKTGTDIGEWIFIATPDDQIEVVSEKLSALSGGLKSKLVVHNSGNQDSSVLSPLAQKGALTVSMHPIQTFRKGDGRDAFRNIHISLEGHEKGKELLKPLIRAMKAVPVEFTSEQKKVVHLTAVFASNYLVALLNSAEQLLDEYGIEEGLEILKPLLDQTVRNIFSKGIQESLSGPVSRGDTNTVQSHLNLLGKSNVNDNVYRVLGLEALAITKKAGGVDSEKLKQLEKLFEG